MPRFRFTVRRMMVAVAVIGVALSFVVLYDQSRRRMAMESRAYWHKDQAYKLWVYYLAAYQTRYGGVGLNCPPGDSPDFGGSARWQAVVAGMPPAERTFVHRLTLRHAYHKEMREKWGRAARSPWSRVPPDRAMRTADYDRLSNVWPVPSPWTQDDY